MSSYIPTTTRVRTGYASAKWAQLEQAPSEAKAEFDLWLNEVKAQAWEEGWAKGAGSPDDLSAPNPYVKGENK